MANNRVFVVHRPSGFAVCLGKRMAWGWHTGQTDEALGASVRAFLEGITDHCAHHVEQDDLMLAMESCDANSPAVHTTWTTCDVAPDGTLMLDTPKPQAAA